jgi:hypothetical protein
VTWVPRPRLRERGRLTMRSRRTLANDARMVTPMPTTDSRMATPPLAADTRMATPLPAADARA